MVTFRNNIRRNNFRRNDRNFKSNGERNKFSSNFSNNDSFQRKMPGRNNHNASKLIEKYSNLAREALSSGDKILSENYFQHADHFMRILNEKEAFRKEKFSEGKSEQNNEVQEISIGNIDEKSGKESTDHSVSDDSKIEKNESILLYESPPAETRLTVYRRLSLKTISNRHLRASIDKQRTLTSSDGLRRSLTDRNAVRRLLNN